MQTSKQLFESFYTDFILRDFFAKVIPGSIVLFTSSSALISSSSVIDHILNLTASGLALEAGFAWLTSFVLENAAVELGVMRYWKYSKSCSGLRQEVDHRFQFAEQATDDRKKGLERHIIIQEATGNGCMAMWVGSVFWVIIFIRNLITPTGTGGSPLQSGAAFFLFAVSGFYLRHMHMRIVDVIVETTEWVINHRQPKSRVASTGT